MDSILLQVHLHHAAELQELKDCVAVGYRGGVALRETKLLRLDELEEDGPTLGRLGCLLGACSLRSLRLADPRLGAPLCSAWTISGKIHAMFVTGPSTGVQD